MHMETQGNKGGPQHQGKKKRTLTLFPNIFLEKHNRTNFKKICWQTETITYQFICEEQAASRDGSEDLSKIGRRNMGVAQ